MLCRVDCLGVTDVIPDHIKKCFPEPRYKKSTLGHTTLIKIESHIESTLIKVVTLNQSSLNIGSTLNKVTTSNQH